mgnify:CR=1 FL=1|tara:strand:+ start:73 stop:387 length:315 start_codon:yes stop_codon:yes gene_type:complete
MSWQDIIKNEEDDPLGLNEYYAKEQKRYDEANKMLDKIIKTLNDTKRIINSEEGEVGDTYLREIASLRDMAEKLREKAFVPGGDDYESSYDTNIDQRMYDMRGM